MTSALIFALFYGLTPLLITVFAYGILRRDYANKGETLLHGANEDAR